MAHSEPQKVSDKDSQITYGHTLPSLEKCTYIWMLEMFEDMGNEDPAEKIVSSVFSSVNGRCKWKLDLTPYDGTEIAQRVVVNLHNQETTTDMMSFKGSCTFMNSSDEAISIGRTFHGYNAVKYPHFIINSMERQQLLDKLQDGVLKVQVKITAILKETTTSSLPEVEDNCLPQHMLSLLNSKEFSDFTIVANGTAFAVHKCVLAARSPVFKAMLKSETVETKVESMDMQGFEVSTVKAVLDFMYSGELEEMGDILALELLRAADMYQINDLINHCSKHLSVNLNLHNVFEFCLSAEKFNAPDLLEKCLLFIQNNKQGVKLLQEQKDLLQKNGSLSLAIISDLL